MQEVGPAVTKLRIGERVVIPFTIFCGECDQCRRGYYSACERTNPNRKLGDTAFGHSSAGLFGYTHLTGGYAGGQAEYLRVPFADTTHIKVPDNDLTDEQLLFLSDIFPTGWQAAVQCDIQPTDTVAVWGCGPVAQFAIRSAVSAGRQAGDRDRSPAGAAGDGAAGGAITINFDEESVLERLQELTHGKGPEKCIDAVGMEAHATRSIDSMVDKAKQTVMLGTDRPHVLREMMYVCRPAGVLSVPGVYGGFLDKIPFGAAMNKGLTIRTGQTHVNRWTDDLLRRIESKQIDPSFVITHTVGLTDGSGDVPDVLRQRGRLHQGDDQTQRQREALMPRNQSARGATTAINWLAFQIGMGLALVALGLVAVSQRRASARARRPLRDYSGRSGFPSRRSRRRAAPRAMRRFPPTC